MANIVCPLCSGTARYKVLSKKEQKEMHIGQPLIQRKHRWICDDCPCVVYEEY